MISNPATQIDPVCGMAVDPPAGVSLRWAGHKSKDQPARTAHVRTMSPGKRTRLVRGDERDSTWLVAGDDLAPSKGAARDPKRSSSAFPIARLFRALFRVVRSDLSESSSTLSRQCALHMCRMSRIRRALRPKTGRGLDSW